MHERTTGALALRPSGNAQGGWLFYSLNTGRVLHRNRWTNLPMPNEVIEHMVRRGRSKRAIGGLVFGDSDNQQNGDAFEDFDEHDDPTYREDEDTDLSEDLPLSRSFAPIESNELRDITDDPDESTNEDNTEAAEAVTNEAEEEESNEAIMETINRMDNEGSLPETTGVGDDRIEAEGGESVETPGVEEPAEIGLDTVDAALADGVAEEFQSRYSLRPRKQSDYNNPDVSHRLPRSAIRKETALVNVDLDREWLMVCFEQAFVTAQFNMKKGLKEFGQRGLDAVMKEMKQLHDRKVMFPKHPSRMSRQQKRDALSYLMFLKEKRSGEVKGRGCADGRKQRIYKTKEETSSPTVTTESFFISSTIDATEGRDVAFVDVPGAFMQAKMPAGEVVHIRLHGEMTRLLVKIDPSLYKTYVVEERGQPVIYAQLTKALYGQLEAALLFWKLISKQFEAWGFTRNEYDWCVVNKDIDGHQCTILWHVDDLKISHKDPQVVTKIIQDLDAVYGQEMVDGKRAKLTVSRGKVHEYLGMKIDFSQQSKVVISMQEYIREMLGELPTDMDGTVVTPAANHLFRVNPYAIKLKDDKADEFHHYTAKLLYLSRRARPDIQLAVSFLCTRVQSPDQDDWAKLRRVMRYLRKTVALDLTLEAGVFNASRLIQWWVDASYAIHEDLKSHTGAYMTFGKGALYANSSKQKINTKSSTEAELVGVDDIIGQSMWTLNFIEAQGYAVEDNLIYQDNQSAILLEKNGRASSSKRTKHINVRYFFVTDKVEKGLAKVVYCPTKEMIGDFFTKPLQGALFRKFRNIIMNIDDDHPCNDGIVGNDSTIVDTDNDRSVLDESEERTGKGRTVSFDLEPWNEVVHKKKKHRHNNYRNE